MKCRAGQIQEIQRDGKEEESMKETEHRTEDKRSAAVVRIISFTENTPIA